MAAREELLSKLRQQKDMREAKGPEALAEWQTSTAAIFRQFVEWLHDAVAGGLLRVEEIPIQIREEELGPYEAPSLKIVTPKGAAVYIVTKARYVVGSYGRVDFECSPRKVPLIRRELGHWDFAHLAPDQGGWSFEELTEDSFWKVLQYLLS